MDSGSAEVQSTLAQQQQQKAKKKKSATQKTLDHLIHCCCRHNSLPAALALYMALRERLIENNRIKRGKGAEGGGASHSSSSSSDSSANTKPAPMTCQVLEELRPELTSPTLQAFKDDPTLFMNSKTYSTLLSLCSGVSPSDYLSSGATNKPAPPPTSPSPTPASTAQVATSNMNWSPQILELYSTLPSTTVIDFAGRYEFAKVLRDDMVLHGFSLNEIGYTALIRVACRANDVEAAMAMLDKAEKDVTVKKRNRLFLDVLALKTEEGNLDLPYALNLWARMQKLGLQVREEEKRMTLNGCSVLGDYQCANYVLNCIVDDCLVPQEATSEAILNWFKGGSKRVETDVLQKSGLKFFSKKEDFATQHGKYEITSDLEANDEGELGTGTRLKSIEISAGSCFKLISMNEEIVVKGTVEGSGSEFCGGGKGKKRKHGAEEGQKRFQKWLNFKTRTVDQPFTHVIDGANVGYCNVNFSQSKHIDWEQLNSLVEALIKMGGTPIVVLHERHFTNSMLPKGCRWIVQGWDKRGLLCRTPLQMNDDWFAIHLCLARGAKEGVEDSAENLPYFVSNDELRDHRFMMLEARDLFRWKERKRVTFRFEGEPGTSSRSPVFNFPRIYSERLQGREGGGMCVPSAEGEEGKSKGTWTEIKPI
ncbi:hypothetical protein TrST_g1328 [Triparma strigata]|uniref:ribonuclease P n=1 Tax=Triparma strigata TaxID=1606541 RepID=A0A9W7BAT8_9STRA|nr:hypothetical protein TrST_g1328 [Triparma strigata]